MTFSNTAVTYSLSGGSITGNASLLVKGAGAVLLGGTNSYSGGTTVQSGTLTATTSGAIPGGTSVANSGTVNLTTGTQTLGAITGNGSFNVTNSATVTIPSIVQGSASVATSATLNLTGPGAVASNLTLANSGSLNVTGGSHAAGVVGTELNGGLQGSQRGSTTVSGNGTTLTTGQIYQANVSVGSGAEIVLTAPNGITGTADLSAVNNAITLAGTTDAWTGTIDLGKSGILVPTGNGATINDQIKQGRNGGTWNGAGGITSSLAASNPSEYAVGYSEYTVSGGSAVPAGVGTIATTIVGDAYLQGQVTAIDRALVSGPNSNSGKQNVGWSGGDFAYHGVVDNTDRSLELAGERYTQSGGYNPSLATGQSLHSNGSMQPAGVPASSDQVDYNQNTGQLTLVVSATADLDSVSVNLASSTNLANVSQNSNPFNTTLWESLPTTLTVEDSLEWQKVISGDPNATLQPGTYLLATLPTGLANSAFGNSILLGTNGQPADVQFYDSTGAETDATVSVVPEPGTLWLLAAAASAGLAYIARRRLRVKDTAKA